MSNYKELQLAYEASLHWFRTQEDRPVGATRSREQILKQLKDKLPQKSSPPEEVIKHIIDSSHGALMESNGPRFFGWVMGSNLASSVAADWMTSTWDQNAVIYACSPYASCVEEITGEWIKELLDLPTTSSFAFTTGCQMAHFTALASARYRILKNQNWDVNEQGLFAAPKLKVFCSELRHKSIDRVLRYLGLGNQAIHCIPVDEKGKIRMDLLEKELKAHKQDNILVLDAADLNIAAFDSFSEIIPMAKSFGSWVHVDGAFGLFARASKKHKDKTKGIELADSWAADAHKWLNVPFDCGICIVKDTEAHKNSMTVSAAYIAPQNGARDEIDYNPEWSRRARSLPVYAALLELGKEGVEDLVDRCCDYAKQLVEGIGKLPNTEVLWTPDLNQGLVRFLDPENKNHDSYTEEIIHKVNASGIAYFAPSTWQGKRIMRVSVVSFKTTQEDINRVLDTFKTYL